MTSAVDQLDEIFEFEARKNPRYAADSYNTILEETDRLLSFPEMAARETSLADESKPYRAFVVSRKYKVIYRFDPTVEQIIVVSVWDCRQNPGTLKEKVSRLFKK
jgi:plasmid stabilization system protein ParE